MPITYDWQIIAECDRCHNQESTVTNTRKEFVKLLRKRGWSIGKETLCNVCMLRKKLPKEERA